MKITQSNQLKTIVLSVIVLFSTKYLAHNIYVDRKMELEKKYEYINKSLISPIYSKEYYQCQDGYHNLLYLISKDLCEWFESYGGTSNTD